MLAKLTHKRFYEKGWLYERKLDGERCLAFVDGKQVTLESRNRKKLNESYPEIEQAIQSQDISRVILDGEIVAFEGNITSFAQLQQRMHVKSRKEIEETNVAVYYYIFDIPYLEGYDLSVSYGLGAGVWSRDANRCYRFGRAIEAGRVWVNNYHAYPAHAAFGGYKQSGIGRETHKMMLDHYQQTKNILMSYNPNKLGFF